MDGDHEKNNDTAQPLRASAVMTSSVEATDGTVGNVTDCLFNDEDWTLRWIVTDTGAWLLSRKVLLDPSDIELGPIDRGTLKVALDSAEVKSGPEPWTDPPVSQQKMADLEAFYSQSGYGFAGAPYMGIAPCGLLESSKGDPHLRSTKEVLRYDVAVDDQFFGQIEDLLIDPVNWVVESLLLRPSGGDARDYAIIPAKAVRTIVWENRTIYLRVTRELLKRGSRLLETLT